MSELPGAIAIVEIPQRGLISKCPGSEGPKSSSVWQVAFLITSHVAEDWALFVRHNWTVPTKSLLESFGSSAIGATKLVRWKSPASVIPNQIWVELAPSSALRNTHAIWYSQ